MSDDIILIQSCELEIVGPLAYCTAISGKHTYVSAMERSAMRNYLERAVRKLDEADERDRCQILPFPVGEMCASA